MLSTNLIDSKIYCAGTVAANRISKSWVTVLERGFHIATHVLPEKSTALFGKIGSLCIL